eukprot:scaffold43478_cov153-Skeletonema_marinoi.AAC.1
MLLITEGPGQSEGGPARKRLLSNWTLGLSDRSRVDEENFLTSRSPCLECGTKNINGHGIFCANFFTSKGGFPRCRAAYCGECYKDYEDSPFPVQRTVDDDEDGEEMGFEVDDEAKKRNINTRDVVWNSEKDLNTL